MRIIRLFLICIYSIQLFGEGESSGESEKKDIPTCQFTETFSETEQRVVIAGKTINYKAVAGNLILKDEKCAPKASVFFINYTNETEEDPALKTNRPITFCFNGGPGSSSVWLHLGVLGPKRVRLTDNGEALPPYYLVDNEYSLLDKTDLVFIDPISTGYSHAIPQDDSKKYHGVDEDINLTAEFIQQYLSRYNRWESPKFILGESYGTTRAIGLASHLQKKNYIYVNGIVLISSVINYQTLQFSDGNDLPFLSFFPSYTAAAWYHRKLPPELQKLSLPEVVEASRQFVKEDYVKALFKGSSLTPKERGEVIVKMSQFTGLPQEYIDRSDLRVEDSSFERNLLKSEKMVIGRFDSRITGIDADPPEGYSNYDPSLTNVIGAFTAAFNGYIKKDLKYNREEPYGILTSIRTWDWGASNEFLEKGVALKKLLSHNAFLRVFVANGYYDMATPMFGTEYAIDHLGIEEQIRSHITMKYYEAGHMMYTHLPALEKLKQDLNLFYEQTLSQEEKEATPL
jgi:carboxypeptidase C (cathepsin A)